MTESPSGSPELELARASRCVTAGEVLAREGLYDDAISRAYYAMFHAACALVALTGRRAKTHDGLRGLLAEHFIRPGLLAPEHGRALARTGGDRNDADYNVAAVFTAADAAESIERAKAFVSAAEEIVRRGLGPAPA